jgi:biotin-dependent carboxylase-like uncharacterized protein
MSNKVFEILQPGMLTTVQDLGRLGYQRLGVPAAGAMDQFAIKMGNRLLSNNDNDAALEATFMGPSIKAISDTIIAITGGDLSPTLNGKILPMWESISLKEGDTISFEGPRAGIRTYICIAGGIDVPLIMESRSTYLRSNIGGYLGRSLQQGDILSSSTPNKEVVKGRKVSTYIVPSYGGDVTLRVVLGPQDSEFTEDGINTFLTSKYVVTSQMDRMGIRLEGTEITHREKADIISDGIMFGSIQIPGNGQPIIMMADRQTTGGYTKIATIISIDIPKISQAQPGDKIQFDKVTVENAQNLLKEFEETIQNAIIDPSIQTDSFGFIPPSIPDKDPLEQLVVDEGVIVADHMGKRYIITQKDGIYHIPINKRGKLKNFDITSSGTSYQVEI